MKTTIKQTVLTSFIAASLGLAGVAAANDHDGKKTYNDNDRTAGEALDDAGITAAIKTRLLEDDRTEGFDINVDTRDGVVTLRGGADSAADRAAATEIARMTEGVVSVNNQITIAADGSEVRQDANTATASGEVREAAEEVGDEVSDAWITSKVKTQLVADDDIAGLTINVETEDKVVRLIGDVPNAAVHAEAVRIAQTTQGVARVDASRLQIRQPVSAITR